IRLPSPAARTTTVRAGWWLTGCAPLVAGRWTVMRATPHSRDITQFSGYGGNAGSVAARPPGLEPGISAPKAEVLPITPRPNGDAAGIAAVRSAPTLPNPAALTPPYAHTSLGPCQCADHGPKSMISAGKGAGLATRPYTRGHGGSCRGSGGTAYPA